MVNENLMMEKPESSSRMMKEKAIDKDHGFVDTIFSWSLQDILNQNLFKVENIPKSFDSAEHYLGSYEIPLLEETRAQLSSSMDNISTAPFAEVVAFFESKPHNTLLYDVQIDYWRNRPRGKVPYKILPGDIVILTSGKPGNVSDLQGVGWAWTLAVVTNIRGDEDGDAAACTSFKVKVQNHNEISEGGQKSLTVISLTSLTTSKRIWKALHMSRNLNVIKKILCNDSVVEGSCKQCSKWERVIYDVNVANLSSKLNESQTNAVLASLLKKQCNHKSAVEIIWGPSGTGKTKTVSMLVFSLLKMKCRTLICAPTNVAIAEVASRVLKLVTESHEADSGTDSLFDSVGDILLFGNKDSLKVDSEIQEVYLDYRVNRLIECFAPLTGWWHCFNSTIDFFEDCVFEYDFFMENELIKMTEHDDENEEKWETCSNEEHITLLEFMRERFCSTALPLKRCLTLLCTHISETYILKHNIQNIDSLVGSLHSFEFLLFHEDVISDDLCEVFSDPELDGDSFQVFDDIVLRLQLERSECLSLLRTVQDSLRHLNLPSAMNRRSIEEFCFQTATLFFCTASSSYKLHSLPIKPLNYLVVDEAAQLKECESTIPLQLPGIRHAILIGDECQLPAMVESNVCDKAGFGRSLFERLSSLGHSKHLLEMQYRMHPAISCFPNSEFYSNLILDAPNVKGKSYKKHYIPGPMFGPYSFINVIGGREELDEVGHSRKNMVEVAIVLKLLRGLYKAWSGQKVRVGVISPYTAQVVAIQEKLGQKYENIYGFSVKVSSIDGFQGSEEDIIIISTVRSNRGGAIGFMSDPRRINVALTRARHCLWILGNERTLSNSESIWEKLVHDAKERNCFFNADEDKDLAKAILEVKKEFDQLDDLINGNSALFRSARWKVLFSEYFTKSFGKLASVRKKTPVLNLLLKLSSGWRPKRRSVDVLYESSSQILKQFKVEGLYVICSIDIVKEMHYKQVLKVWDLLPLEDIPRLAKRLEGIFERYTDDFISHCNEKCLEGDLEVPKTWKTSFDIARYKSCSSNEIGSSSNPGGPNGSCYVENSKVSDSLLLMKFYSLSSSVVSHLLSDRDGRELELPFEVTDEELEIILFQRSTFILGRSGTGKTTVLTMKLFKKEHLFHMVTEGLDDVIDNTSKDSSRRNNIADDIKSVGDGVGDAKKTVLRQLFVTVSPKLCYAVKHHVTHLKSFASGGKYSAEGSSVDMEDIDDAAQFKDIPNSLFDIPPKSYPLVITFFKFLMMLDGTMGNSYFERFSDMRQLLHEKVGNSGSISAQTLIRTKEVNFEKFCAVYWPRFNEKIKNKLDSSRVFTEIISHIKGSLQAGKSRDGSLSREDYVSLSEGRISTLNRQKRDVIYGIFEGYEKMKAANGDFDMADFVNDLHLRLKTYKYEGEEMDFVYIDEVQDLTMRQIALFKHICRNVEEGFVFSGDTAQTIARGIDFRFEDIRSLFYNEFVLASRGTGNDRSEKGQISKIFHLNQNFRTHDGVLKLAQSVIDLLYRFFPSFIDVLRHETSLIYGEAPILLESGNDENAIVTIFGNSGNLRSSFVGFGAEQVILVRDDDARKEIDNYVGNHALVLTVVECKGLEFQDVLLYNFFGSSPLKNKWRVIYEFMKEQDLLDADSPSFPSFIPAKHNVLCSELKQLYVAITRTRQRLWICENVEEFSRPMFDYWTKKGLVQVRKLDDSLAQAMQVSSSPEEWKSRGYKLLREGNYEVATMCFERAGDERGEKLSKAAGLKAAADRMHSSNPEMASVARRQAAEIFESIGKAEYAAECFYMLKEYDRAGVLQSLLSCTFGFLMFMLVMTIACVPLQLKYMQKAVISPSACLHVPMENSLTRACIIYNTGNNTGLQIKDAEKWIRLNKSFWRAGALMSFLLLEVESGNFLEAAGIAKQKGELVHEADLLGKGGHFKEASLLILWFVFANSLWSTGSKGWPLKQFLQKEELLTKAKLLAKDVSDQFYEFVHTEAEILLNSQHSLLEIHQSLDSSRRHSSIRGEILSARKILDMHLHLNTSKYWWENDVVSDLARLSERNFLNNQVSAETLVYFWNFWKDKIVNIFKFLACPEMQGVTEYRDFGEFCLNYMGVKKEFKNLNAIYFLMNSDAQWLRDIPRKFIRREGSLVSVDVHQFVSAAQSYWRLELLSVGMNVLTNLEALYNLSVRNSLSLFCQSRSLVHIYEVAKFLLNCQFLSSQHNDIKALRKFTRLATESFYDCIYPRDWRESLKENMISLRRNGICRNLLKEVIFENVSSKNKLSYAQLGRITLMILGSGEMLCEPYEKKADGLEWNSSWKAFIEDLCRNVNEESYMQKLHEALVDTYNANWRIRDYILPGCFLYMLERQLILLSYFQGNFLTTKSSFVEWLIYQEGHGSPSFESLMGNAPPSLARNLAFIVDVVQHFLYNDKDMMDWIRVTENVKVMKDYHAVVVLRLVVIICLVYLNFGWCADLLSNLLGRINITKQLPRQFYDAIQKRRKYNFLNLNLNVVAEAFSKIDNPLVSESKDNVLRILFPKTDATAQVHTGAIEANTRSSFKRIVSQGIEDPGKIPELPSNVGDVANWNSRCGKKDEDKPPLRHDRLWEICEALKFQNHGIDERTNIACDPTFKVDINRITCLLKAAIDGCFQNNPPSGDKKNLLEEASIMLDEMRQLNAALEMREPELESDFSTIGELLEKLLSRRPRMELFLNQIFLQQDENPKREMAETSTAPDGRHGEEYGNSKAEGSSNSAEGERNVSESNVETGGSNPDMENKGKEGKQQVQEK
ncbi:MAMMARY TURMOR VIRUS RECEPTOR-like protein 1 2 MTVR1 2 [Salix purpurea]|uniref:MAMMARY TURMOR VIRUS RECEPTOR-like protein 1 2 MTVR1 2 n=1 Tax=Salix purpurea TaxID=77065 RepID=A0A9Q0U9U9_SALPP|nr:MAMMARY TURMOR VIRUS RECEPTOR-like protein 1 2 MTVR1 2 [Salix purpurea]